MARIGLGASAAALLLACAHPTPVVNRYVSYDVKSEVKPVGDVEGHFAGAFKNHGVCLKNVGRPDEEIGVLVASGTFDAVFTSATTTSTCTMTGRTTCTFDDKSTHTDEWTATCRFGPGGKLVSEGRGSYVEGTGRFEGIKGTATFAGKALIGDPENLWVSTMLTGETTLPKK